MPRSQGISEDALAPQLYTAIGKDGVSRTCPALVINDLTTNERYSQHSLAGRGVSFYCGVPILTPSGVPIGVYYVTDDKPRYGLSPRELKLCREFLLEHHKPSLRRLPVLSDCSSNQVHSWVKCPWLLWWHVHRGRREGPLLDLELYCRHVWRQNRHFFCP